MVKNLLLVVKIKQMKQLLCVLILSLLLIQCGSDDGILPPDTTEIYFPPINGSSWETSSVSSLGWNEGEVDNLYSFLEEHNTRAFIVLKDGKIVLEEYWGKTILNTAPFGQESNWYWASADKTITSFLIGKAQEEGHLSIEDKTSDHLGLGWTSMPKEKEDLITVRDQLTMTTGLDYAEYFHCVTPDCLHYKSDAGTEWYYYNGPYLLLKQVIANATGIDYNSYTDQKLEEKIGMSGEWLGDGLENLYWSNARSMARFGLLILNDGKWEDEVLLNDINYINSMRTSSQSLNPSYGYLWWLNGKSSIIYPILPTSFNQELAPNAPDDLYAAIGRNGQIIDIVPSENLVVVRVGEAPDNSLVPTEFHDDMWGKINLGLTMISLSTSTFIDILSRLLEYTSTSLIALILMIKVRLVRKKVSVLSRS